MDEHKAAPKRVFGTTYGVTFTHGQVHYLLALLEQEREAGTLGWGRNRNVACHAKLGAALNRGRSSGVVDG